MRSYNRGDPKLFEYLIEVMIKYIEVCYIGDEHLKKKILFHKYFKNLIKKLYLFCYTIIKKSHQVFIQYVCMFYNF